MKNTKIITYNVNGIRAAISKGWYDWLGAVNPDIVLLQETKADVSQVDMTIAEKSGYHHYWHSAEKKGYSGVTLWSKQEPDNIVVGSGDKEIDKEGRIIRADFGKLSVLSVYVPSGSSGDERQTYKMEWLAWYADYIRQLKKKRPELIIGSDFNICHKPIDIHNPVSNAKSSGFLPEEREWMDQFIQNGFIDTFRFFNQQPHQYTWWTFRANARERNLGWRIDYIMATQNLESRLAASVIMPEARHSDHCPVLLELKN